MRQQLQVAAGQGLTIGDVRRLSKTLTPLKAGRQSYPEFKEISNSDDGLP